MQKLTVFIDQIELTQKLSNAGIRVKADLRNEKIGFKILVEQKPYAMIVAYVFAALGVLTKGPVAIVLPMPNGERLRNHSRNGGSAAGAVGLSERASLLCDDH